MITQEMVEVGLEASKKYGDFRDFSPTSNSVRETLTAVYPLILEEAAKICSDKWLEYASEGQDNVAFGCSVCEKEIRSLKDKTDEARNG